MSKQATGKARKPEFVSQPGFETPPVGNYIAKCVKVADDISLEGTEQLVGTFEVVEPAKEAGKTIRKWWNLQGFEKDEDGEYVLDKNGERIPDAENTKAAKSILCQDAYSMGIPKGQGFDREDLMGLKAGIVVTLSPKTDRSAGGSPMIKSIVQVDKMKARIARISEGAEAFEG